MIINYHNRRFRTLQNTENGETSSETIFHYKQEGNIVTSEYSGGEIVKGHLIAKVDENGNLDMRYHQVNSQGELMTGVCQSTPEMLPNGKIKLYEKWQWTSGNHSFGESILEEL
jgi:hypothetical protein